MIELLCYNYYSSIKSSVIYQHGAMVINVVFYKVTRVE